MSRNECLPFGRGRKATVKPTAAQYQDQPANLWTVKGRKVAPKSRIQADSGEGLEDLDGAGTVVAILDSGIQKDHCAFSNYDVEFEEKVILCKNFAGGDEEDCDDLTGHGTQCAGLACGFTFEGVDQYGDLLPGNKKFNSSAPGARLMVCKVGRGDENEEDDLVKSVIAALKFIIDFNKEPDNEDKKVDVISISIGFLNFYKDLANAVQEAVANDIIVVCCASNDGANISNPITYPARLGHVLCIGACDKHGQPAKFSAEGREVDFVELGVDVWAPDVSNSSRVNEIAVLDGTSFSTPSVAGLICVLIQDLKRISEEKGTDLWKDMHNVWCIRDLLKSMSVMHGHHDSAKGYGKLIPNEYFKKGDEERVRICNEILGRQ